MMIFLRHGLAFLSVPKTGTHAYQAHLGGMADIIFRHPQHLKHMGLRKLEQRILPLIQPDRPLETFAVIREPVDWLGSWYRYRSRPEVRNRQSSTHGMSFDRFVEDYLSPAPPPHAAVGSQANLLTADAGKRVDHLYRYDYPSEIARFLSARLQADLSGMARLNVSPVADLHLSDELRQRLHETQPQDFALYQAAIGGCA
ncbi:gamma-glutamyl kinase [Paracoccus caeni]|uniref:Gamma-glutamyl kinase n=1 Tax=Paracoccus caeni TaxID=657651 RepID=A0A934SC56_9RHOB|nr:gamma-glutamyl kinase [Paracoccus caeni]MBK4214630.1 gamma-glutamyl kinase [Paracoccus caeni]